MKTQNRLFMDVHVLQTVPPSCINRDDTGSPKTAVYGGVTRARVSSQCWKHAMREMFVDIFSEDRQSKRTKHIVSLVAAEIAKQSPDVPAQEMIEKVVKQILEHKDKKGNKEKEGKNALLFISNAQVKRIAAFILEEQNALNRELTKKQKEKLQCAFIDAPGVDIALFGRMVATNPSLNNDACAQVAHSISTHRVSNEFDYFTAMDDCSAQDNAGAGHLGTVEFNSSTLYRYGTVAVHQLHEQLGADTPSAVCGFLSAFVRSMPTGKQNTFANRTPADMVYVVFRRDQPVNLVGAFEKPVRAGDEGYVSASIQRLKTYAQRVYGDFVDAPEVSFVVGAGIEELAQPSTFNDVLNAVKDLLKQESGRL